MTAISYVTGDATAPLGEGNKVVAHICNDEGKWGAGFVLALSRVSKAPELAYRQWFRRAPKPQLGDVQFVPLQGNITVANMIGQHGIRRQRGSVPIRYEAVRQALSQVGNYAQERQATVHMPRIGCGLAGGSWNVIEPIITEMLCQKDILVTVYDWAPGQ